MRILKIAIPVVAMLAALTQVQAQTVQTSYSYPNGVSGVAVDYVVNRAYVLLPGYYPDGTNAVQVLDGVSNKVLATFPVPVANAIAVNLVTSTVYVAGSIPSSTNPSGIESVVVSINPWTGTVSAVIPVTANSGYGIVALAVDPLRDLLFVSNASDNAIDVITDRKHAVTSAIDLAGQTPAGISVNFITGEIYAALNNSQVAIISEKKDTVTYATYGNQTSGIAVDLFTNREYVTDGVFDVPSVGVLGGKGQTEASIPVGLFPQGIDVDFITGLVFAANEADGTVSKISTSSNSVLSTTTVDANSIAVNPKESRFYAVGSTSVTVLTEN
jgi:DNA-binding beta-propeller fold protein YncE